MVLTTVAFAVGANGSGKTNFFSGKEFGTKLALAPLRAAQFASVKAFANLHFFFTYNNFLFAAIRFVLSDIFTTLTATERQKLLHVRLFT